MIDDLITRAVAGAIEELKPQLAQAVGAIEELNPQLAQAVERRLAVELAGTQTYFRKPRVSDAQIVARFNGRNANDVARALGVSRRRVYYAIKQARKER